MPLVLLDLPSSLNAHFSFLLKTSMGGIDVVALLMIYDLYAPLKKKSPLKTWCHWLFSLLRKDSTVPNVSSWAAVHDILITQKMNCGEKGWSLWLSAFRKKKHRKKTSIYVLLLERKLTMPKWCLRWLFSFYQNIVTLTDMTALSFLSFNIVTRKKLKTQSYVVCGLDFSKNKPFWYHSKNKIDSVDMMSALAAVSLILITKKPDDGWQHGVLSVSALQ